MCLGVVDLNISETMLGINKLKFMLDFALADGLLNIHLNLHSVELVCAVVLIARRGAPVIDHPS